MMTKDEIEEAVEMLIAARGDHRRLDAFPPTCRPQTYEDGHAIQEAFVKTWSVPVAGYKIGCTSEEAQKMLGAPGPFPGRVFAPVLLKSPARVAAKAFHRLGIEPVRDCQRVGVRFDDAVQRGTAGIDLINPLQILLRERSRSLTSRLHALLQVGNCRFLEIERRGRLS